MKMVSVIIPVYNSEVYLEKCINSILNQSYKDLEVIVIDDGSTDLSGVIADSISQNDSRVRVIHQPNHGLIYSRKQGIMRASGEYILFVDSDDYIAYDMIQSMINHAIESAADVVATGANLVVNGKYLAIENVLRDGLYTGNRYEEIKKSLIYCEDYYTTPLLPYLWCKLWRRSLIEEFVLKADEKITIGEDVAIGLPTMLNANSLFVDNTAYYYYLQNSYSMMKSKRNEENEFKNAKRLYDYLLHFLKESEYYNSNKNDLIRLFVNQMMTRAYSYVMKELNSGGIFPYMEKIPDEVILYGAGEFGKSLYSYLFARTNIKCWIDSNAEMYREMGLPVLHPDNIDFSPNDIIIVAVLRKKSIYAIKEYLIHKGVSDNNIFTYNISEEQEKQLLKISDNG